MADGISIAKIVVYLILLQPALFCVWKHGKTGFLGWFYVQLFCVLRIVTGAIGVHGSNGSLTGLILNSVGLSPLFLSIAGILHEARRAMNPRLNRRLELFLDIQYHTIVSLAMILTIVAVVNLEEKNSVSGAKTLLRVGSAITALSWLLLVAWGLWTLATHKKSVLVATLVVRGGKILLTGAFFGMFFVLFRLIYGIVYLQLEITDPSSSFISSKPAQIILSVIPEMLCTIALIWAGIRTTSLKEDMKKNDYRVPESQSFVMSTGRDECNHTETSL